MKIIYRVEKNHITIKDYLKEQGCSRNLLKRIRVHDCIYVNGEKKKNYEEVFIGDEIIIDYQEKINQEILVNSEGFEILYEDRYMLAILKSDQVASQPSRRHPTDNIVSLVKHYFNEKGIEANVHIINRLDFSTTGIVLIAKSGNIHYELSKIPIEKKYVCWVHGILVDKQGTIDLPIRRAEPGIILRCVVEDGKRAITHYRVIKESDNSLLEVRLETGRTHQIRVHMAHIGHPVIGDKLYGRDNPPLYLHCYSLVFIHPITRALVEITHHPQWAKEVHNA